MSDSREPCIICGKQKGEHNGIQHFCPLYPTYRAALPAREGAPSEPTVEMVVAMLDEVVHRLREPCTLDDAKAAFTIGAHHLNVLRKIRVRAATGEPAADRPRILAMVDDQPITEMPAVCQTWRNDARCAGRIVIRNGFHVCEACGVSYGAADTGRASDG